MKKNNKQKFFLVMILCMGFLVGCDNNSYVGKWTATTIRLEGEDKDFQKVCGYKQILTLNADGSYDFERISVDEKKCSEEDCKNYVDKFKKSRPNPKWKIVTNKKGGIEGIVLWHDGKKEPDEQDKLDFIIEDGYLQMVKPTGRECYER